FDVAGDAGGDAEDDQHHLGQLVQAEDDEQDRQDRQRRDHRQNGEQGRQRRAEHGYAAGGDAEHQTGHGGDAQADAQAGQAGGGVLPEQVLAGALVLGEGHAVDGGGHLAGAGQQLVVGVFRQACRRTGEVGEQQQGEGQQDQQQAARAVRVSVDQAHRFLIGSGGAGASQQAV